MSYINWKIKTQTQSLVNKLSDELTCGSIVSRLLINRGITDKISAMQFLEPTEDVVHDPFLLNDMNLAVNRILKAVENKEKICIYGDYDVDGITSVSVLYLYLKNFTDDIFYYIPDRFSQGYGINNTALEQIAKHKCSLVITVDTGISAINEVKFAKTLGMDVVVTDHHECQSELTAAVAVVNPKRSDSTYPFTMLAGVGVVYKLITAIDSVSGHTFHENYIDLVAIGTIADIMPLLDENRYIVKRGIEKIANCPNAGLKALIDVALNTAGITASSVGFAIAPRINAAGRMERADSAVRLFVTPDKSEARSIAHHLCDLNKERQKIENDIFEQAIKIIDEHDLDRKYNALVLWKEGWHSGVIGIVASKLKEKYNKPVVLFSVDKLSKGSGRSVPPFNLYDAFEKCSDILLQFGGHKYAAGVLIENESLYLFRDRLSELVGEFIEQNELSSDICVECELPHNFVTFKTAESISALQPYGKSNEVPLFCIRDVNISDIFPTSNNKHLRMKFFIDEKNVTGFYFGKSLIGFDYREGDTVDIVCEVNLNEYRNTKTLQLIVHDMRYSEKTIESNKTKRIICDNEACYSHDILPTRSDIAFTYKYLLQAFNKGKTKFNLDTVANLINKDCLYNINYEKAYFSLKILLELGIISGYIDDITLVITYIAKEKKFSLNDSVLLMSIYDKAGIKFGN